MVLRGKFHFDGGQFRAWFIFEMIHSAGALIPIATVGKIAFDLVQHSVNPRSRGVAFELLDQVVRRVPVASESQLNGLK